MEDCPMISRRTMFLSGTAALAMGSAMSLFGRKSVEAKEAAYPVTHTDEEWRKILAPDQYRILRRQGTEPPFTSPLNHEKRAGTFDCAGCQQALFRSADKFDSGTGWPSFTRPIEGAVGESVDKSFFMVRTEVHCSRCGGHLGHVFPDGPKPTGLRYCINGVALTFAPSSASSSS
jgi:peptide-methionine (R)-S-oxide reductase